MGSRGHRSTRNGKTRPAKRAKSAENPTTEPAEAVQAVEDKAEDVVGQLDDTRSVLSVALRALDNIDQKDDRRLDAPVVCRPYDVATVLRVGLGCLEEAREALQTGVVEGKP
jgi:hypothetical protein